MADTLKKIIALVALVICALSCFGNSPFPSIQGQMQGNTPLSRWRPTQDYSGIGYVGSRVCAQCHAKEAATQLATPMAHALERPADCQILSAHPRLTFRNGPYAYEITRQGNGSIYSVSDG